MFRIITRAGLSLIVAMCWSVEWLPQLAAQPRPAASTAKDPVEAAHLEFSLSPDELDALRDQTFDLLLKNGK